MKLPFPSVGGNGNGSPYNAREFLISYSTFCSSQESLVCRHTQDNLSFSNAEMFCHEKEWMMDKVLEISSQHNTEGSKLGICKECHQILSIYFYVKTRPCRRGIILVGRAKQVLKAQLADKTRCRLHVSQFKPRSAAVTNSPWLRGFQQTFHACRDSVSVLLQGTLLPWFRLLLTSRWEGLGACRRSSSCSAVAGLALSCAFRDAH